MIRNQCDQKDQKNGCIGQVEIVLVVQKCYYIFHRS